MDYKILANIYIVTVIILLRRLGPDISNIQSTLTVLLQEFPLSCGMRFCFNNSDTYIVTRYNSETYNPI